MGMRSEEFGMGIQTVGKKINERKTIFEEVEDSEMSGAALALLSAMD